ncbi:MAG: T9SS type A sorting domain-containing protein [Saprospiraceae bacterium]
MTFLNVIVKPGLTILCLFMMLHHGWSQAFSKQQVQKMIERAIHNKVKTDVQAAMQHPEQWGKAQQIREDEQILFREGNAGISSTKETESEIHAAVNPKDTNNLIVAAMKFSEDIFNALTFPIYYTKDFGRTWKLSQFNGVNDQTGFSLVAGGGDPIIVFDDKGVAYLSWLTLTIGIDLKIKAALHWAISNDGGATWKRQNTFIDEGELADITASAGQLPDKEWLASDLSNSLYRGNVYVAYAYLNSTDTTYNIFVKTKAASGTTFGAAVDLTPADILFAQFTSIDVDAQGVVHVMFAGAKAEDEVASLYHCKSTNGGASFSAPVKIAPFFLSCFPPGTDSTCNLTGVDPNRVYPCPHLRVDKSNGPNQGNLYVVWTANGLTELKTVGTDIYFSKSENGGATWSQPRVLNNDKINKVDQFFPSMAVNPQGTLVITWYDRREDSDNEMTQYYMTTSKDGGDSFENDFAVSTDASDFTVIGQSNAKFGVGEYTQVVTTNGYAIPFWADGRSNDGNIEIFTSLVPIGADQTTDVKEVGSVSEQFSVTALYPNPVRNIATLEFELKEASRLNIQFYSLDGKLQKSFNVNQLSSGSHKINLNVKDLTNGQYWCVIHSDFGFKAKSLIVKH